MEKNMLEIRHLSASFFTQKGEVKAVNDVCIEVPKGKIVGIVGESGCGKSMTVRACMGLLKYPGRVVGGEAWLDGKEILSLPEKEKCAIRGDEIAMVFQDPMTSLNPVVRVGKQVTEALRLHRNMPAAEARREAVAMFEAVGIPEAEKRLSSYPHQLSGGLRQRVMIAMAMICHPKVLIADEPTTALDVTVEAQILRLMKKLCSDGTSVLIISHNLGVIAQLCDYVYVMYAGRIVEQADTFTLFEEPLHPYTRGLLSSVSSLRRGGDKLDTIPGVVPNLLHLPAGCSFSLRCDRCEEKCRECLPDLMDVGDGHKVRCHFAGRGEKA